MIRPAASAGVFYPKCPKTLRKTLQALLQIPVSHIECPSALIVPHAGYLYSGQVAADAYASLLPHAKYISRVVLLGPSHYELFNGVAAPESLAFSTPLGNIPIDTEGLAQLKRQAATGGIQLSDRIHAKEYCLEVQLPFLQTLLEDFCILPFILGHEAIPLAENIIEACLDSEETLVVVSSDMSHNTSAKQTTALNKATAAQICAASSTPWLGPEQACGFAAIQALRNAASKRSGGFVCKQTNHSGAIRPTSHQDSVVGYGAFLYFTKPATAQAPQPTLAYTQKLNSDEAEEQQIKTALRQSGYFYAHRPNLTQDQVQALCHSVGAPWQDSQAVMVVEETQEKAFIAHTNARIEAHNECAYAEMPPRYLGLYCVENKAQGGEFFLLDSQALMEKVNPQYLPSLQHAKFVCSPTQDLAQEVTLLRRLHNRQCFIYTGIGCCEQPNGMYQVKAAVDEHSNSLISHLNHIACDPSLQQSITWRPGDFLLFDNHRFLHGRAAFHSGQRTLWHLRVA